MASTDFCCKLEDKDMAEKTDMAVDKRIEEEYDIIPVENKKETLKDKKIVFVQIEDKVKGEFFIVKKNEPLPIAIIFSDYDDETKENTIQKLNSGEDVTLYLTESDDNYEYTVTIKKKQPLSD